VPLQDDVGKDFQQPQAQELVVDVRPYWEGLAQEQRVAALTLDLGLLRERAKLLSEKARAQAGERARAAGSATRAVHDAGCAPGAG
jgi:hypothetical protein